MKKLIILLLLLFSAFLILNADAADKKRIGAYNMLVNDGNKFRSRKDRLNAEIAFRDAIEMLPDQPDAYINLAIIYMDEGNFAEAIKNLNHALQLLPDDNLNKETVLYNLGLCYFNLGEHERARKNFSAAQGLKEGKNMDDNKRKAQNLLREGSDAFKNNDIQKAISLLEQSIRLNPKYAEAYYRLGVIYVYQKDADRAVEYFKKTIEINPSFTQAYTNLGSIFGQLKYYSDALVFFQKALSLEKDNPKIYYNIGLIYAAIGKKDSADEYFAKAKELCLAKNDTLLLKEIEKVYTD